MPQAGRPIGRTAERGPSWRNAADAWFKLLAAIAIGYFILAQAIAVLRDFAGIAVILIGGILLAYFFYPAIAWLNRRLPLWAALSIVYLSAAVVVAAIFYLVVPPAVMQLEGLVHDWPTIERTVRVYAEGPNNPFFTHLPATAQQWLMKMPSQVSADVERNAAAYTTKVVNALEIAVGIGAVAIAIPVVSIYMLAESSTIKRFFVQSFRPRSRGRVVAILYDVDQVIGGFIRGQIIVAVFVGILAIVGLMILHVRYAVIIGAWAGIMDIIPYIGPIAGAIPAVIVALIFNGAGAALGAIVVFTVINQLEAHVLAPRIISTTVKITPLGVIFALLICGKIFGFIGLLVAVPLAGIVRVILTHVLAEEAVTNAQLKPGLTQAPRTQVDPRATES
ncbi:MAG: AI-2E family transporter [Candidatus Eremiobacteraeota bacterium]|nr:AI-2E family transporter [Candidatus Eremiobacteraeota bacterium]